MSSGAVVATEKPLSSCGEISVRPSTIPRIWVVPIFLVIDQVIPTGRKWKIASPISHRKLYMPAQNWETSASDCVRPFNRSTSPMMLRKPSTRPPQISAGMIGAKISPSAPMIRCRGFWLVLAADLTASLLTPSMPAYLVNS